MKWAKLFALAAVARQTSATWEKGHWKAETTGANSTELIQCMAEMKAMLEANPKGKLS